jgi:TIR domain-containing protein
MRAGVHGGRDGDAVNLDQVTTGSAALGAASDSPMPRPQVFLSYSHLDEVWKKRLAGHLAVLAHEGLLEVWSDQRIAAGGQWREEIRTAMEGARVAVLLISKDFLTSQFVSSVEVPGLIKRRAQEGMPIVPVIVRSCLWQRVEWLAALQVRPRNGKPLASFRGDRVDKELAAIADEVRELVGDLGAAVVPSGSSTVTGARPEKVREGGPPSAEHEGPGPLARVWSSVVAFVRDKPAEAAGLLGGGGTVMVSTLGLLGFLALRARERLIGIPPLSYPKEHLLATGADALGSLLWRGLAALVAPHPALRWSAATLLALVIGLMALGRLVRRRGGMLLIALAVSAVSLSAGVWLYTAAVHLGIESPATAQGLSCAGEFSSRLDQLAAFETCSWLINGTPANERRRHGLGGLLGWLILACLVAAWATLRARGLERRQAIATWGLLGLFGLLVLCLLRLLPMAHAYAEWGLSYPPVKLRPDEPTCDPALARAISQEVCCAADVSAGAEGVALFVWGSGCGGYAGFLSAKELEKCLVKLQVPQPLYSRCL